MTRYPARGLPGRAILATRRYDAAMTRFAPHQPDLFAAPAEPAEPGSTQAGDPVAELRALLARLRVADPMPWPDAAAAMAEEHHALGLARLAGAPGEALAAAILEQTERLLSATD